MLEVGMVSTVVAITLHHLPLLDLQIAFMCFVGVVGPCLQFCHDRLGTLMAISSIFLVSWSTSLDNWFCVPCRDVLRPAGHDLVSGNLPLIDVSLWGSPGRPAGALLQPVLGGPLTLGGSNKHLVDGFAGSTRAGAVSI